MSDAEGIDMRTDYLSTLPAVIVITIVALGPFAVSAQLAPPGATAGQPKLVSGLPVESVTVVGIKPSEDTIKKFVETRATPTAYLGKMARWATKICPLTVGPGDKYAKFVTLRIRDVATAVGAPLSADPGCKPNLEVVFTTTPQVLLDGIRKGEPEYLGYYRSSAEADQLAMVTHPIQAWYTTTTRDIDGTQQTDSAKCSRNNDLVSGAQSDSLTSNDQLLNQFHLVPGELAPCATVMHVSGSRVNNGLSSGFNNVLIVAEPAKLFDYEIGPLADYISLMALSQPASLDKCQELPSISNMLAKDCASVSGRITDGDLAYLRALYKMPDGTSMEIQRDHIRFEMQKTLVTDKGG
jgi:hypothetical protein